jgi:2-oxoglutarate ferredoxin oxidoreductase subunit gamma
MRKTLKKRSEKYFSEKIFVAGAGGQGILFLGKALYLTAVLNGLKATYIPSYGAEVRGGAAMCMITVSQEKIPTPVFRDPDVAIILNDLSLRRYGDMLKKCPRIILYEIEGITSSFERSKGKVHAFTSHSVPSLENVKSVSVYAHFADWFSPNDFLKVLDFLFRSKSREILEKNRDVFLKGYKEFTE